MSEPKASTRVVLVDDADDVRLLVRLALEASNTYEVVGQGASGREAVELAQRHHPDLVLLDVSMTDMDGFTALPLILEQSPDSRVVMLSGFQDEGVAAAAARLGAAGYVDKRGVIGELPDRLAEILGAMSTSSGSRMRVASAVDPRAGAQVRTALAQLADQVERFGDVFGQAAIGMAILTLDRRLVRANGAFAALVGRPAADLVGSDFASLVAADDASIVRDLLAGLVVGALGPAETEVRLTDGDRVRWVMTTASLVADRAGAPQYVLMQVQDVTARRQAESERELLRSLTVDVATAATLDDAFAAVLARICRTAGWSYGGAWVADEAGVLALGPTWSTPARGLAAFEAAGRTVTLRPGEGIVGQVWAGGAARWFENIATTAGFRRRAAARRAGLRSALLVPVRADQQVVAVLEFFVARPRAEEPAHAAIVTAAAAELGSVLKRRQAEDALANTAALLARAEEVARVGCWEWHRKSEVMRWSDELYRVLGHEPQSFAPSFDALVRLTHADDRGAVSAALASVHDDGLSATVDFRVLRPDGRVRTLQAIGVPVRESVRSVATIGTVQDITERAALERALRDRTAEVERSNDELRRFAELAAERLAQPLGSLAGFALALAERYRGSLEEPMAELVGSIAFNASSMRQLVDDLLVYAAAGAPADLAEEVDLAALAADVVVSPGQLLTDTGATVEVGALPVVAGNAVQLRSVLHELLTNAVRHTVPGTTPSVRVAAAREDDEWRITVTDNGPGVDEADRDRIFDLFERVGSGAGGVVGTGVGLAICRRVVERHGGHIWVEPGPGGGSRFCLTLPA